MSEGKAGFYKTSDEISSGNLSFSAEVTEADIQQISRHYVYSSATVGVTGFLIGTILACACCFIGYA